MTLVGSTISFKRQQAFPVDHHGVILWDAGCLIYGDHLIEDFVSDNYGDLFWVVNTRTNDEFVIKGEDWEEIP